MPRKPARISTINPPIFFDKVLERGFDERGTRYLTGGGQILGSASTVTFLFSQSGGKLGQAIMNIYDGKVWIQALGDFDTWTGEKKILPKQAGWVFGVSGTDEKFVIEFTEFFLVADNNPVEFRAEFTLMDGWKASLHNLEDASAQQCRFILDQGYSLLTSNLGNFRQTQRGGRPKGATTDKAAREYRRIINYRRRYQTDSQFLVAHPDVSRSKLERAVRWATSQGIWTRWDSK